MKSSAGKKVIRRPPPRLSNDFTVEILGRRYAVTDMQRASQIVSTIRDQHNLGASQMGGQFPIRAGDVIVGYVSYNGKVWQGHPDNWEHNKCVLDPYAEDRVPQVSPARVVRNNPSACALHDDSDECRADPSACRYAGCDGRLCHEDPVSRTRPRYYADTKSFFCDACRSLFLREYRWDDDRGEWVEKIGGGRG